MKILRVMELAFAVAVCAGASCGQAQEKYVATQVSESCDLGVLGEKNTDRFLTFDRDLRMAIEQKDAGKLALLTQFPLRVDDRGGNFFIHDAQGFAEHFAQIFTPRIRKAILETTRAQIWCNYTGIMYGSGQVWVNATDKGFFVMTVNLPEESAAPNPKEWKVDLACHTDKWRILIDSTENGVSRYRAWKMSHSLFDAPDMEMAKGKVEFEGTGPCAHRVWDFHSGKAEIQMQEPGCYGEVEPPRNAQAELFVTESDGAKEKSTWCF